MPTRFGIHTEMHIDVNTQLVQWSMLEQVESSYDQITHNYIIRLLGGGQGTLLAGDLQGKPLQGKTHNLRMDNINFRLFCFLLSDEALSGKPGWLENFWVKVP